MSAWAAKWLRWWVVAWVASCLGLPPALAQTPAAAGASEAQQRWIAEHPVVQVGVLPEFLPFYAFDGRSGATHGYAIELMALWGQRLGLRFETRRYPDARALADALSRGEIDMTPLASPEQAEAEGLLATRPVLSSTLVLAARRDVPDTSPTADFAGRRIAIVRGSQAQLLLQRRYPRATVVLVPTPEAAVQAVSSGSADIVIGVQQVLVYQIERLLLANLELRRHVGAAQLGALVAPDSEPLRELLDQAIAGMSPQDHAQLASRWLPQASTRLPLPAASAQLSDPELAWVAQHGRLRVGYDPSFAPVTLQGDLEDFQGYGADLMRLLADKAGLTIETERGQPFADLYERGRAGELDVIVGMARTARRRADYDFVGPFLSTPTALFTRPDEVRRFTDTRDIGQHRLALLRGHFLIPELQLRHPGLHLLELDRQDQVLSAVVEGAADVGLGNLLVVNELIERRFTGLVAVSGVVRDGDSELYLAVPRQFPALTHVLARALEAVNDTEVATLRARWLAREVPTGLDWVQVLRVGGPVVLGLMLLAVLLALGLQRLRRAHAAEIEARRQAEASIEARGRFLAYLSHELRGTLGAVSSGAEMLRANDDPGLRQRLTQAIAQSATGLLALLEQTLRYERLLQMPLSLHAEPLALGPWWHDTLSPASLSAEAKGLVLDSRWSGEAPTVTVDGLRLQQVVQNLLNNAIKFTPSGTVRVLGELRPAPQGLRLCIEVHDSGPGLSEADRAQLFQPYAQGELGRRSGQGAGLGLAICQQIVGVMGGELQVRDSALGTGCCFALSVPVAG